MSRASFAREERRPHCDGPDCYDDEFNRDHDLDAVVIISVVGIVIAAVILMVACILANNLKQDGAGRGGEESSEREGKRKKKRARPSNLFVVGKMQPAVMGGYSFSPIESPKTQSRKAEQVFECLFRQ